MLTFKTYTFGPGGDYVLANKGDDKYDGDGGIGHDLLREVVF